MDYKNYVYWVSGQKQCKVISDLFNSTLTDSLSTEAGLKKVGKLFGIKFPYMNVRLYEKVLEYAKKEHDDEDIYIEWYGEVVDSKKYLLAKLKYGI